MTRWPQLCGRIEFGWGGFGIFTLFAVGCGPPAPLLGQAELAVARVEGATLTLADAALVDTLIVRLANQGVDCPLPSHTPGWTVSQLFAGDQFGFLPDFLRCYCVFERAGAVSNAIPLSYGSASEDMVVVAPLGRPTSGAVAFSTTQQIRPVPDYGFVPLKAVVNVLDSSPSAGPGQGGMNTQGNDPHGQKVATLASSAMCDRSTSPACGAFLATQLTMGFEWDETAGEPVRVQGGGTFGSQAHLARAIERAVLNAQLASISRPLVLNLSLGWHPDAGANPTDSEPVRAVYDALRYAACRGTLTVAAVGNMDTPVGEPNASGPLLPAAWEGLPAPDLAECTALLGPWSTGDDPVGAETYSPLIYGVSGIDISSHPLSTQRPGSSSRRTAASAHLTTFNVGEGKYLEEISGTSASSAVVSAAAGVLRTHMPAANAHEIMRVLGESSRSEAAVEADFCFDTGASAGGPVQVVTVCDALAYACEEGLAVGCDPSYTVAACDSAWAPAVPLQPPQGPVSFTLIGNVTNTQCIDNGQVIYDVPNPDSNCPSAEFYAEIALPMTLPMPQGPQCPWCPAYEDDTIELITLTNLANLLDPTVTVRREGSDTYYALGPNLTGYYQVVQLPPGAFADTPDGQVTGVAFTFLRAGEMMYTTEPLYLTW